MLCGFGLVLNLDCLIADVCCLVWGFSVWCFVCLIVLSFVVLLFFDGF